MIKRPFLLILGILLFLTMTPAFAWDGGNGHQSGNDRPRPNPERELPGPREPRNPKGHRDNNGNFIGVDRNSRFKGNPGVKASDRIGSNSPLASKNSPLKNMRKTAKIKDITVVTSEAEKIKNTAQEKKEAKNIEINIYFAGPANPLEFSNAEIMINGVKINNDESIKYNRTGTKARITISQSDISDIPSEYNISIVYPSGITDAYVVSANPVQNKKLN